MISAVSKLPDSQPQRKRKSFFPRPIQVLKMLAAEILMMSVIGLWISVLKLSFDFKAYHRNGHLGPGKKNMLLPENMRSASCLCHVSLPFTTQSQLEIMIFVSLLYHRFCDCGFFFLSHLPVLSPLPCSVFLLFSST